MGAFVHMTHPDLEGDGTLVPDDAGVLASYEARGWVRSEVVPEAFDPDAPDTTPPGPEAEVDPDGAEPDPLEAAARLLAERDAAAVEPVVDEPDPLEAAARMIAERDAAVEALAAAVVAQQLDDAKTPPTDDDPDDEPGADTDPGADPADKTGE